MIHSIDRSACCLKTTTLIILAFICTQPAFGFGPFDYTNPQHRAKHLKVVEQYHFDLNVETLKSGIGDKSVWNDLDYTLRVFPNHHRALAAMTRLLAMKDPGPRIYGKPPDRGISYYFERALRFAPKDGTVHLLYGIHFHKAGDTEAALSQYQMALKQISDSADLHYNLGLLYIDLKQYEKALVHAHKAYGLGHPLPGLREKLRHAGVWQENPSSSTGG